ncbi:predicted protein [Naegleria gruberi]|uniref:Predicted protein n=1 Tax=Naegleria gruberi TaxID=5762 RepID=D2V6H3_NAEGR|nr:uncharacterized protein NAEGRDRAFT_47061 [Naegleria gruberi]EFC47448.1 predicted protein [Naegleria gruberi]|eukprot:XP_002680192.1 predicted protein [Naegleria gruberi strain NEG-M]
MTQIESALTEDYRPVKLLLLDHCHDDRENNLHQKLTLKLRQSDRIVLIYKAVERFKKHRKVDERLVRDLDYGLLVVQIEGTVLRKLRNQDREVALAAVEQNGNSYSYIKGAFQKDLECVRRAASTCGNRIGMRILNQTKNLFTDEERMGVMKLMLENSRLNLVYLFRYMSPDWFKSLEFCMELLPKVGNHLFSVFFDSFRGNRDALLQLLRNCTTFDNNFPQLVEKHVWDKELVLEMVSRVGISIEHVPRNLQADRDVILTAVKNDGRALMFAHPPHNADFEIVTNAVKSNARAFFYVDNELKSSKKFIEICMRENLDDFIILRKCDFEVDNAFKKFE